MCTKTKVCGDFSGLSNTSISLNREPNDEPKLGVIVHCANISMRQSLHYFVHTVYSLHFLFYSPRFRLQKYANAREAVHAISSEASWYYELPCFCSCIKNYLSERYHIYSTIHM